MSNPVTQQVQTLATQLQSAVLAELPNFKPSPAQVALLAQATATLAESSLLLASANGSSLTLTQEKIALSVATVEDVVASELENAAGASERIWSKVTATASSFAAQLVAAGITAAITSA